MFDRVKGLLVSSFFVLIAVFYAAIFLVLINYQPLLGLLMLAALSAYMKIRKDGLIRALILGKLDTKLKRFGFALFYVGIFVMLTGMASGRADIGDVLQAVMMPDSYAYERYQLSAVGAYMAAIGLFLAYLYGKTVKPLFDWIRSGKS